MVEPEEHAQIERARNGDEAAFDWLWHQNRHRVNAAIQGFFGRSNDAEDVAQEAFQSAFSSIRRFSYSSKFSTWLYRIAINKCLDRCRRDRRRGITQEDGDATRESGGSRTKSGVYSGYVAQLNEEVRREVANQVATRVLEEMGKSKARIVRLAFYDRYTAKEVAEQLEMPNTFAVFDAVKEFRRRCRQMHEDFSKSVRRPTAPVNS